MLFFMHLSAQDMNQRPLQGIMDTARADRGPVLGGDLSSRAEPLPPEPFSARYSMMEWNYAVLLLLLLLLSSTLTSMCLFPSAVVELGVQVL